MARTHVGWARARIARGGPEDLDRAQRMLEQAEWNAERLGGELVASEVAELGLRDLCSGAGERGWIAAWEGPHASVPYFVVDGKS